MIEVTFEIRTTLNISKEWLQRGNFWFVTVIEVL